MPVPDTRSLTVKQLTTYTLLPCLLSTVCACITSCASVGHDIGTGCVGLVWRFVLNKKIIKESHGGQSRHFLVGKKSSSWVAPVVRWECITASFASVAWQECEKHLFYFHDTNERRILTFMACSKVFFSSFNLPLFHVTTDARTTHLPRPIPIFSSHIHYTPLVYQLGSLL